MVVRRWFFIINWLQMQVYGSRMQVYCEALLSLSSKARALWVTVSRLHLGDSTVGSNRCLTYESLQQTGKMHWLWIHITGLAMSATGPQTAVRIILLPPCKFEQKKLSKHQAPGQHKLTQQPMKCRGPLHSHHVGHVQQFKKCRGATTIMLVLNCCMWSLNVQWFTASKL